MFSTISTIFLTIYLRKKNNLLHLKSFFQGLEDLVTSFFLDKLVPKHNCFLVKMSGLILLFNCSLPVAWSGRPALIQTFILWGKR